MQQAVGEFIRQIRRQQSLTQTELGGEHFSKSYVSAVERDKITPSLEALHFFAEQLGQPSEYFIQLKQEAEEQGRHFSALQVSQNNYPNIQEEFLNLLNTLLEGTEQPAFPLIQSMPTLSPEMIATLSPEGQARYSFLHGLITQEQQDFSMALKAFEQALVLAPTKYQPAILDQLGTCYYLSHVYQTALGYHKRALRGLEDAPDGTSPNLRLKVELHCGNDYRAMGVYERARTHYERSRQYLNATHDMKTAGLLYLGLGYCTYANTYEKTAATFSTTTLPSLSEIEREFQHAISYLLQSRTLYQVSGNRASESTIRLLQAMVLLDLVTIRRQGDQEKEENATIPMGVNSLTLLEEAQEQCHQVLIAWQDASTNTSASSDEPETILYTALAYLVRIYTQRVALARIHGYTDTAKRERLLAARLCQQVLDTLSDQALLWITVRDVVHIPLSKLDYQSPSLPRLPDLSAQKVIPLAQVEVYFAAGEFAEELGRAATTQEYALDCYRQADQCFRTALTAAHSIQLDEERDPGSLLRYYQRCMNLLEERIQVFPEGMEGNIKTLLDILKTGLAQLQHPFIQ
jgi:tetratricopeptide (TPR) repeat protein